MSATRIIPPVLQSTYDTWHFAPAVLSHGHVFVSGIIGTSPDGERPASALSGAESSAATSDDIATLHAVRDPEAQFDTAFEALRMILAHAGADLSDIVEMTTYHVDMTRHMAAFTRSKDRYIRPPYPAWTAIGVSELLVPGGLMELRAIARAPA